MSKFRVTLVVTTNEDLDAEALRTKIQSMLPYLESYENMQALLTNVQEVES